ARTAARGRWPCCGTSRRRSATVGSLRTPPKSRRLWFARGSAESPRTMGTQRCTWRGMAGDPLYEAYHDQEWGVPEFDSRALWEKLVLDGFQAGLSWITILKKREAFRAAFANFDPDIG